MNDELHNLLLRFELSEGAALDETESERLFELLGTADDVDSLSQRWEKIREVAAVIREQIPKVAGTRPDMPPKAALLEQVRDGINVVHEWVKRINLGVCLPPSGQVVLGPSSQQAIADSVRSIRLDELSPELPWLESLQVQRVSPIGNGLVRYRICAIPRTDVQTTTGEVKIVVEVEGGAALEPVRLSATQRVKGLNLPENTTWDAIQIIVRPA